MPLTPLTLTPLGGPPYQLVSAKLWHPTIGVWVIDAEISADALNMFKTMPSGKCVVLFGGVPFTGTIDPKQSGQWGPTGKVRVLGGGGGWGKVIPKPVIPSLAGGQDFHADNGVMSTIVYNATALAVGETVIDAIPELFPNVDFVRSDAGPASMIFGDKVWYLLPTGVTTVGPRLPAVQDTSLVLRDFDPVDQRVTFSCNVPLIPGTILIDPTQRFGVGVTPIVGDVEQIFDGQGSHGTAWMTQAGTSGVSQLANDLKAATLAWTRAPYLRAYRYRFIAPAGPSPGGGPTRLALQAAVPQAGIPDLIPLAPWAGIPGFTNTLDPTGTQLAPGSEVLVVFANADPTNPIIISYSLLNLPIQSTIDATTKVNIGPTAPMTAIGGPAGVPLVLEPAYAAFLIALGTFATACAGSTVDGVLKAAATALGTALGLLPPPGTTKVTAL